MSDFFNEIVSANSKKNDKSFIINDPNGELLLKCAFCLESKGYNIKVLNFANPIHSHVYNPFCYIREDDDAFEMVTSILKHTSPILRNNAHWESAEYDMLSSLCLYLYYEAPPQEQNFSMIMELLRATYASSEPSDLDRLFELLEEKDPNHIALKKYHAYKNTQNAYFSLPCNEAKLSLRECLKEAGRCSDFVSASLYSRLKLFDRRSIGALTIEDNIELYKFQEEKTALFITYNHRYNELIFILALLYEQSMRMFLCKDYCSSLNSPIHINYVADYENTDVISELITKTHEIFNKINKETTSYITLLDRKIFIKKASGISKNTDYDVSQIYTPYDVLDAFFKEFK